VVFNPKRHGAQAQVKQLVAGKIPVVIAVSCNVATSQRLHAMREL
jgi:23S rRNA (uracil1939-C5)-methyltransferase